MEELKKFIKRVYDPSDGALNSTCSEGNGDDQFADGEKRGFAWALLEVAGIIGLELPPFEEWIPE